MLDQTVTEFLFGPCSESLLEELTLDSTYWESVSEFISDNEQVELKNLSYKQRSWLIRIKDDLLEKAG